MTRCATAAALLAAGVAGAQPAGDPTPGTLAPLVVIVNPMDGATVGELIRVQARVHHPLGADTISAVTLAVSGAGGSTLTLARNGRYDLGAEQAIFEGRATLEPGSHALVATAIDGAGRSTSSVAVTVTSHLERGDGNLLLTDDSSQLCTACHSATVHGSEKLGRRYGAWTTTCRDCHTPHDTVNASLIRESIRPPWYAGEQQPGAHTIRFSTRTGYSNLGGVVNPFAATFANADATGPCQVCHTRTARWRADGEPDEIHRGNCTFCHRHGAGLKATCDECHGIPPATGAHAAHVGPSAPQPPFPIDPRPLGCGNCHPADQRKHGDGKDEVELNPSVVLPGGTLTVGSRATGSGTGTTCLTACHFPLGAPTPASQVAWSSTGPLPCNSCHTRIAPGGLTPTPRAGPSLHDPVFPEARPASGEPTSCYSCHDAGAHDASHLTGAPGLRPSANVNATCVACHTPPSGPASGAPGQVLHTGGDAATARTPPLLPGWTEATIDAASGDFHGGRRGTCYDATRGPVPCAPAATPTGYGGTLKAPFYRGYPAMPCATCHAGHASGNAFLLASVVNGVAIAPGTIDRTGAGAERLCEACHAGGRHERCVGCHTNAYTCDENAQCWMDGGATHVDPAPAGSACFYCHGHEGILHWTQPGPDMRFPWDSTCDHCHSGWAPSDNPPTIVPPDFTPPTFANAPVVSGITSTGATITWRTNENASTWVEYGVGMPGYATGSAAGAYDHAVTLAGLAPGTTYVWRVRSGDAYRNQLRTELRSFTTTAAGAVPVPDIVAVGWTGVASPQTTMTVGLTWYPVTAPTGNPVQYRVQLASDASFTGLVNGSPSDSGWISGSPTTVGGRAALQFGAQLTGLPIDQCTEEVPYNRYYWRVRARDSVTGTASDWSTVDGFNATSYDPYGC
jgi:hypothetical protein